MLTLLSSVCSGLFGLCGTQAYEILSDPEARGRYDEIRAMGSQRKYTGPQVFKSAFRSAEEVCSLSFSLSSLCGGGL